MSFTWNGKQLEVVKCGDDDVLYTYNILYGISMMRMV